MEKADTKNDKQYKNPFKAGELDNPGVNHVKSKKRRVICFNQTGHFNNGI